MDRLQGIFPPIPTPFSASGEVDRDGMRENLAWWNRHALAGIVVLGSNGEAVHLDRREKLALIEQVRAETPQDRLVLAGTGLLSTKASIRLTHEAADAGADVALVLPPFFYRGQMTRDVLVGHYTEIADASPLPILLYNMPANTGVDLDANLIVELSHHERIVGVKDSSGNVGKLAEIGGSAAPGFRLLAGSAGFLLPALAAGAVGGVCALANIAPSLCVEILERYLAGDLGEALALQRRIVRANAAVTRGWGIPALKAAMELVGLVGGPPRPPLRPLSFERVAELREILVEAGILEENR